MSLVVGFAAGRARAPGALGHGLYCFGYQDDAAYGGGYLLLLNQWANFSPRNFLRVPYAMVPLVDPANGPVLSEGWALTLAPTG